MRHEEACLGMFVRLLSDWHGIPKGTVGSIDTVETGVDGSWCFTIFWELHRPLRSTMPGGGPHRPPIRIPRLATMGRGSPALRSYQSGAEGCGRLAHRATS